MGLAQMDPGIWVQEKRVLDSFNLGLEVHISKPDEIKKVRELNGICPPLYSCLCEDMNGMTRAILEVVARKIVQIASNIRRYVRCTLLNSTKSFQDVVKFAQKILQRLFLRRINYCAS